MSVALRPLAEVIQDALQVLCREIGIVDTVRFLSQFTLGYGDYTEVREELFADTTLDDIITERGKDRP